MMNRIAEIKAELKYIDAHRSVLENDKLLLQTLETQLKEKETILKKENKDVTDLEKMSFQSLFHSILGDKDEKLIKERYEAEKANLEYQRILQEYNLILNDVERLQYRINQYDKLFHELEELQLKVHYDQIEILELKESIENIYSELKEVNEAIGTGEIAQGSLKTLETLLNKANDWSTFDMFSDSMLADIMKRENLSKAQQQLQIAKGKLQVFQRELQDVDIEKLSVPEIVGFDFVMDFFFDNIFFDYTVKQKIKDSLIKVRGILDKVNHALNSLYQNKSVLDERLVKLNSELKEELMKL